jgi:hypothetical protein
MNERLDKSLELADWIVSRFDGLGITGDGRSELAATCYYVVWQHQAAVPRLYRDGLIAPATALLRCAWDAYIRGMWLERVATEDALNAFKAGGSPPSQKNLMQALEIADVLPPGILLSFHQTHYSELCDLTHTGIVQVSQQLRGDEICAQQEPEQLKSILAFVDSIALSAFAQAALIADDQALAREALNRMALIEH